MSVAPTDAKRRVKLYALNASRQWDDKGTGHVTSCYHEPLDGMSLLVKNESDGSLMLESKIQIDTQYQKQQGTLIVWTESDNYDLALSFQEKDGCNEIWEKICQVQGRDPTYEHDQDEEQEEVRLDLIYCDYANLQEILEQVNAFSQTTRRRDVLASEYIENDYIDRLIELFRQAEEKQDLPALYKLHEIFKQLFLYDRPTLTEVMVSEPFIMDVIGIFEYEPPCEEPRLEQSEQNQEPQQPEQEQLDQQQEKHQEQKEPDLQKIEQQDEQQQITKQEVQVPEREQQAQEKSPQTDLSESQQMDQSELQQISQSESQQMHQSESQQVGQSESQQMDQSASQQMDQSTSQQMDQSASQQMDQSASQQIDQSEQQQMDQSESEQIISSGIQRKDQSEPEQKNHLEPQENESLPLEKSNSHLADTKPDTSAKSSNDESDLRCGQLQKSQHSELLPNRKRHREFLKDGTTFKEVIPFDNQKLVDKIHQTYRVQYLQSSVLPAPSILEENAYASLTNILFFNKVEIVTMIQENREFLKNLFNQIISNETGIERKKELVLFLREYCLFSQTIQPKQRESFFKTLASLKILSAVEVALSSNDQVTKSAAIDIFTHLVEYNPHMTREHAVQQQEGYIDPPNRDVDTANILQLVIEHITTDQDPELGTATQLACIIKLILDPENMSGETMGKHSFLELFYLTCMDSLVKPIRNATAPEGDIKPSANDRRTAQLLSIMLELLTFFMEHHYIQLRNYIVSSDLLTRIISLIKSRHKFLVLCVIRFFRRLIATKDENYFKLIIDKDLFSPIIRVLKSNNGRYNLLDSAILEMFDFISKGPFFLDLVDYVLTNFGPFLESIEYASTFKDLRRRKEFPYCAIVDDQSDRSSTENQQLYFGNHSKGGLNPISWQHLRDDVDDDIDPDSDDDMIARLPNSESDPIRVPGIGELLHHSDSYENADDIDDVEEEEDDEEEAEDDDEIRMDDEDCEDEIEPQFKKRKTK